MVIVDGADIGNRGAPGVPVVPSGVPSGVPPVGLLGVSSGCGAVAESLSMSLAPSNILTVTLSPATNVDVERADPVPLAVPLALSVPDADVVLDDELMAPTNPNDMLYGQLGSPVILQENPVVTLPDDGASRLIEPDRSPQVISGSIMAKDAESVP